MTVSAYAKINLTLEVFGKRPDGYHALRSVVAPISFSDALEIETTDDGSITSDTGYDDDLCVKAARALKSSVPSLPSSIGATIHVTKRIPAGGGLGGGSADAAAVLRALNEAWSVGLPLEELAELGAQVGSDVPALVIGGPVIMEGRGEKVEDLRLKTEDLNLVLVNPGVRCSTREVYERCVPRETGGENLTARMAEAWSAGDFKGVCAALANDLQDPAVRLHSEIADALVSLRTAGAEGVMMSGSGSCVFGLVPDAARAEELSVELNRRGFQAWPVHTI